MLKIIKINQVPLKSSSLLEMYLFLTMKFQSGYKNMHNSDKYYGFSKE